MRSVKMHQSAFPKHGIEYVRINRNKLFSYAWYHLGGEEEKIEREDAMNALYNLGDLVNKIAFGIAVYSAAGSEEQVKFMLSFSSSAAAGAPELYGSGRLSWFSGGNHTSPHHLYLIPRS